MKKKSPFHDYFDIPQRLSEGEVVLCAECFDQIQAQEILSNEIGRILSYDQIEKEHVRWRFPDIEHLASGFEDNQPAWFIGANPKVKGSKPVWVFDRRSPVHSNFPVEFKTEIIQ